MSKNLDRIDTLELLERARKDRRSLVCPTARCFSKPTPAAFVINLNGATLLRLFKRGLYVYRK